ncbi:MAG: hypothetical protein IJX26_03805 [Clostridia bacterium]|nr:hypothetical protein [Clostridia bacterium]
MRGLNINKERAKIRCENLRNCDTQLNSRHFRKKYLGKHIIKKRVDEFQQEQIRNLNEKLEKERILRDLFQQVSDKINKYQRIICFEEKNIKIIYNIVNNGNALLGLYRKDVIDIDECIKGFEDLDNQINDLIKKYVEPIEKKWEEFNS